MKVPAAAPVLVAALGAEVALAAPVVADVSFCPLFTSSFLFIL